MKRLVFATEAQVRVINEELGTFSVKSAERNDVQYEVSFVSPHDNSIPSCACMDWKRNYLPCKHMLAVMQMDNAWGWESLPLEYRESPYISLDVDILFKTIDFQQHGDPSEEFQIPQASSNLMSSVNTAETGRHSTEIPKKAYPKRTHITRCCDLLAVLKNLVHECTNPAALEKLEENLKTMVTDLEAGCESASGIILTPEILPTETGTKRKKKQSSTSSDSSKTLKLDKVQPKKRHLYNNRFGHKAQMMKTFYKTNMPLEEMITTQTDMNSPSHNSSEDFDEPFNNDKSSTSCVNFTPVIRKRTELRETLLKNGPHQVSLLQLKSLEPFLSRGTEMLLVSICEEFRPGWLFDEVINSFFWCLQERYSHVIYAPSTSMLVLQKQSSSGRLWKDVNISTKRYIIAPWNPTDDHWTLVVVDLLKKKIVYLDPLQHVDVNSMHPKLLATFMPQILLEKFGMSHFEIESPRHTLQTDLKSCGVLICWYALQIIEGKPITDPCNEYETRVLIYNEIRGSCMKRRSGFPYIELLKCPNCKSSVDHDKMECQRCFQQYHIGCLDEVLDNYN